MKDNSNASKIRTMIIQSVRRVIDVLISVLVLVFFWPIILVLFILLRLDSPGPAIFKQVRVGKNRRTFAFYKFRTMVEGAKELFPELYVYDYSLEEIETMYFKTESDPRLTRFGKWLRKTSLDEIPNFINVLKGEMTLVGPRPDIPEMIKYYKDWQMVKFNVKPGITGLAQIKGRGKLRFQETLQYDVEYVRNQSLLLDLRILFQTIMIIGNRHGAF